jgi:putative hydrolase of the HAD superfamily
MSARAVLFDLDGTLMDHEAARTAGFAAHLATSMPGIEASELERLDGEWRRLETLHYDEYTSGRCSYVEQRRRRVRGIRDAARSDDAVRSDYVVASAIASEADVDRWFAGYLSSYRAAWRRFDDVLPALEALERAWPGTPLAIVTNGEGEPQRAKLAAIGLSERFPLLVASGEVGVAKPEAAIFALACERLGVEPARAMHVGDRLDFDAQAAAAAGLTGVWLDRGDVAMALPDGDVIRIATLHELPGVLGA